MVNEHPADFHPVELSEAGIIKRNAEVLNPHNFDDGPAVPVFEDASERVPMPGIGRAGQSRNRKSNSLCSVPS
jgi:hypothetical protein